MTAIDRGRDAGSWRSLLLLFALALALFSTLRWQPVPWLKAQIEAAAARQHVKLSFADLGVSGLSLVLHDVSLRAERMRYPLRVQGIAIAPAWSALWSGEPAVRLVLFQDGLHAGASIVKKDGMLWIRDLAVQGEAAAVQAWWPGGGPMLDLAGRFSLAGALELEAGSGQPLGGSLELVWKQAGVKPGGMLLELGDYNAHLQSGETPGVWTWEVQGGEALVIHASGRLHVTSPDPERWLLSGRAGIQGRDAGMTTMLGGDTIGIVLSGSLLHPQWRRTNQNGGMTE